MLSSVQLGSFGIGGVVSPAHLCHAPKTLGGDSRQMHGELTTQLSQLVRESERVSLRDLFLQFFEDQPPTST